MTTQLYITGTDEEFTAVERFRNITKKWSHPSVCYKRRVEEVTGEDNTIKTFTILSCPKEGWSVRVRSEDFEWSDYTDTHQAH